jgi:hypothetical protein
MHGGVGLTWVKGKNNRTVAWEVVGRIKWLSVNYFRHFFLHEFSVLVKPVTRSIRYYESSINPLPSTSCPLQFISPPTLHAQSSPHVVQIRSVHVTSRYMRITILILNCTPRLTLNYADFIALRRSNASTNI